MVESVYFSDSLGLATCSTVSAKDSRTRRASGYRRTPTDVWVVVFVRSRNRFQATRDCPALGFDFALEHSVKTDVPADTMTSQSRGISTINSVPFPGLLMQLISPFNFCVTKLYTICNPNPNDPLPGLVV